MCKRELNIEEIDEQMISEKFFIKCSGCSHLDYDEGMIMCRLLTPEIQKGT